VKKMNKILAAATLAITGLMAASAMAAPDYRNDDRRYSYAYGQNHHDLSQRYRIH
jgi:hypothetical protein